MSNLAVRARGVSKVYRLYNSPGERLLDIFGMLANAKSKVRQHIALQDVSFDIARGEKVGIIGRNGAGKSTLLKMITRVTEPSSGTLEVHGQSRALLQIGTGFHVDFTGRENVSAYLASLGVGAQAAKPLIEEAIAFAELEDYADQPVKTYSTGMAMRLMFAASTMMKPDLLVIDEVLGVGDAYFQRKSFERIRQMCDGKETTLLLVTHDIYSAATLCDRMIWIDRGRILIDADPPNVTRAYEDAIREQEERRLRAKALQLAGERGARARKQRVIIEIQSANNQPPPSPVWICALSLLANGTRVGSLRFDAGAFDDKEGARLLREGSNWSEPAFIEGRLARALNTHGSPFHKVAGVLELDDYADTFDANAELSVNVEYRMDAPADLKIMATTAEKQFALGLLPPTTGAWTSYTSGKGDSHTPAVSDGDFEDWNNWIVADAGASVRIEDEALQLDWSGAAGPYLLMTPPIPCAMHERVLVPFHARTASGRLGVGAFDETGAWARTYEFAGGNDQRVLEFPVGGDGLLRLAIYSAAPEPLSSRVLIGRRAAARTASVNTLGTYGAGDVRMEAFRVFNHEGRETLVLELGKPARFEIDYTIMRPGMRENAQVLLAFQRDGVHDVFRVIERGMTFDHAQAPRGRISVAFEPLPLAPGAYSIPVMIAAEGYYDTRQDLYFSINPSVYFVSSRAVDIRIVGSNLVYEGTGVVGQARWSQATEI